MDRESDEASTRARAVRRVLLVTLVLNVIVAAAKLAYGWYSGALAIRADGFHSTMDALGNVVALIGVSIAARPADDGHPYGHHKIEVVVAALVGALLLVTARDVAADALRRVTAAGGSGTAPTIDAAAFVVLLGTLAINVGVTIWEARAGRRWNSPLLITDAMHTRSDVAVSIGVIISTAFVAGGVWWADAVAAAVVAGFVAFTGVRLLLSNAGALVDSAVLPPQDVRRVALQVADVLSTSHVRSRGARGAVAVDLRVQVAPSLSVAAGHEIAHAVSDALQREFPDAKDVVVHVEPASAPGADS